MLVRILVFLFAIGAAGIAAMIVLASKEKEQASEETVQQTETVQIPTADVLVAAIDLSAGEVLAPSKLRWQAWPIGSLNESYIVRDARPEAPSELAGSFLNQGFTAGEPVRMGQLSQASESLLSSKLGAGKRAVALKINAENTAGGFILPGDRVDVMHTLTGTLAEDVPIDRRSRIIVANVRVLAIDQTAKQNPEGTAVGETATLELSPRQAELIAAGESTGMLTLVLRAVTDHVERATDTLDTPRTVRVHRGAETETVTLQ